MISLPDKPPVMPRTKYPHTRALLESLLAEHRPAEDELDPELLSNAVALLQAENEDGLKAFLKSSFDLSDDLVSTFIVFWNSSQQTRSFFAALARTKCVGPHA